MTRCPRCNRLLFADSDRDYGTCIVHGPIFIGQVLPEPGKSKQTNPRTRTNLPPEKVAR